ncbi:unnamed protein product [Pseudo-nitzschia multistriata]|uniref:Uncharacterized protein n=1 Tax=Pseudo-nitzschia multistriata TaxID=183589 RepID=A0A448ZAJ5_9STRA|nr:unnamed protein product [Pseudo-nitzschia multistriata]
MLHAFLLLATLHGVADAFCTGLQGSCHQPPQSAASASVTPGQNQLSSPPCAFQSSRVVVSTSVNHGNHCRRHSTTRSRIFLVSEEDVLEAVERAEGLWEKALAARTEANALIDRAEVEANASAETVKKSENTFMDKTKPVSMEQLVEVDKAAKASLEATTLVNEAMKASEEADRLEAEAEEALKKSEEVLDQHLIDYPDSALAD